MEPVPFSHPPARILPPPLGPIPSRLTRQMAELRAVQCRMVPLDQLPAIRPHTNVRARTLVFVSTKAQEMRLTCRPLQGHRPKARDDNLLALESEAEVDRYGERLRICRRGSRSPGK